MKKIAYIQVLINVVVQVYWFDLLSLPLKEAIFSIEPPFSKFVKLSDKSFQEGDLEIILGMSVLVPASK